MTATPANSKGDFTMINYDYFTEGRMEELDDLIKGVLAYDE